MSPVRLKRDNYKPLANGVEYLFSEHCLFHDAREEADPYDWACCKVCQHRFRDEAELGELSSGDVCPLCKAGPIRIVGEAGRVKPSDP